MTIVRNGLPSDSFSMDMDIRRLPSRMDGKAFFCAFAACCAARSVALCGVALAFAVASCAAALVVALAVGLAAVIDANSADARAECNHAHGGCGRHESCSGSRSSSYCSNS